MPRPGPLPLQPQEVTGPILQGQRTEAKRGFNSQLCHAPPLWPGARNLVSLSLSVLICAMGLLMAPAWQVVMEVMGAAVRRRLLLRAKSELLLLLLLSLWLSSLPRPHSK